MTKTIRKAARALLLNEYNEILLMRLEGLDIVQPDGIKYHSFWATVGGAIEKNESLEATVIREMYEETGIADTCVNLGPLVWHSKGTLIFRGTPTLFEEYYFVVKTNKQLATTHAATEYEKKTIKEYRWWSCDELQQTNDAVFPRRLKTYLPDIIAGNYPEQSIDVSD